MAKIGPKEAQRRQLAGRARVQADKRTLPPLAPVAPSPALSEEARFMAGVTSEKIEDPATTLAQIRANRAKRQARYRAKLKEKQQ